MTENVENSVAVDPEIAAISAVYGALKGLDSAAQSRVLMYVSQKLGLANQLVEMKERESHRETPIFSPDHARDDVDASNSDESDEINPVAQRWIKRSSLSLKDLSVIFSVGGDTIDLIAKKVPGESKKERMHNVLLLRAMASYLASGAPRATHKDVKEACTHYDAWDTTNFATYLKSFATEIGGSKEAGYTLNARGLSSATDLIRQMVATKPE